MPTLPPSHSKPASKSGWERYHGDKDRHQRGYGWRWEKLRKTILARDKHLCQSCLKAGRLTQGNHVDHITPKAKGGTDDPDNLQVLCAPCHREKTASVG